MTLAAAAVAALAVLASTPTGTKVKPDGDVLTLELAVDIVDESGGRTPHGPRALADAWKQVVEDTWGAAFDRLPFRCYKLELKLDFVARGPGSGWRDGRHAILVSAPTGGRSFDGAGFNGVPETSRNATTGDGTRSFESHRDGALPADAPATVVAHEIGHLLGLGDDRVNGAPRAGREGTMMVGGVPGVDVGKVQRIDKDLVDRIGAALERHVKDRGETLPPCQETWNGTLRANWNGSICTGVQQGTITLEVAGTKVSGSSSTSGRQNCPSIPFSQGGPQTGKVTGELTADGFRLHVVEVSGIGDSTSGCWGTPNRPIPVKRTGPDTAEARFEWSFGPERYDCEIKLEREDAGEPVG